MFIYRNALKNLLRNRGRNILVSVILLIVMTAMTVSLAIRSTSQTMISDFGDSFGVETQIIADWENAGEWTVTEDVLDENGEVIGTNTRASIPPVLMQQFVDFANSDYVQSTQFAANVAFTSDDLDPVPIADNMIVFGGQTVEELMEILRVDTVDEVIEHFGEEKFEQIIAQRPDLVGQMWGYSDANMMREFRLRQRVIDDGRMIENPGEVILGRQLAELNSISVGDTINITGPRASDTGVVPLTVVGIFTDFQADLNSADVWLGPSLSDIIVHFDTLIASGFSDIFPLSDEMRFFLRDPEAVEPFLTELREKGLINAFTLFADIEGYNRIVEPVQRMSSVATTFGIVILLTGAVVLIFLSIMNIRERKYEVGVLRAIGMKKKQLARGMIYESLSLVVLCTVVGLPLGVVLSNPVSGLLLEASEIAHTGVTLGSATLPLILAIAVGLGVVSSLIGILYITRYEPMKILQERN